MGYKVKRKGRARWPANTFRTFEDLEVYQVAREFRKTMYAVTRQLPDFEKFEIASQIRRAAVSLTNNIAEGHGRYHFADQVRFFLGSRGSLQELVDDLNICDDERYLESGKVVELKSEAWRVLGLINGYLALSPRSQGRGGPTVHEDDDDARFVLEEALSHSTPF